MLVQCHGNNKKYVSNNSRVHHKTLSKVSFCFELQTLEFDIVAKIILTFDSTMKMLSNVKLMSLRDYFFFFLICIFQVPLWYRLKTQLKPTFWHTPLNHSKGKHQLFGQECTEMWMVPSLLLTSFSLVNNSHKLLDMGVENFTLCYCDT